MYIRVEDFKKSKHGLFRSCKIADLSPMHITLVKAKISTLGEISPLGPKWRLVLVVIFEKRKSESTIRHFPHKSIFCWSSLCFVFHLRCKPSWVAVALSWVNYACAWVNRQRSLQITRPAGEHFQCIFVLWIIHLDYSLEYFILRLRTFQLPAVVVCAWTGITSSYTSAILLNSYWAITCTWRQTLKYKHTSAYFFFFQFT